MLTHLLPIFGPARFPTRGNTLRLDASSSSSLWTTNAGGVLSGHPTDGSSIKSWTDATRHTPTLAGASGSTASPQLLLLTQRTLRDAAGSDVQAWPAYIAGKAAVIETLPFDGLMVHSPHGSNLMDGTLHSSAACATDWTEFAAVNWVRPQHNFAMAWLLRNADFFDDWTNTIQSYQNFAIAVRDAGLTGICFDNEEYAISVGIIPIQSIMRAPKHWSSPTRKRNSVGIRLSPPYKRFGQHAGLCFYSRSPIIVPPRRAWKSAGRGTRQK